jgi:hypothetical protein
MNDSISIWFDDSPEIRSERKAEPQRIGDILEELLAQYERRFPGVRIAVVETPATAI